LVEDFNELCTMVIVRWWLACLSKLCQIV